MVLLGVLGPLVLAIVTLLALCIGGFSVLSSVRAYVGGESLWSKARANAVAHLRAHAVGGLASDYRRFQESLAVPLGDRRARLELDKPRPDMEVVTAGFLAGENSPEDIPGLIRLYRYFRHVEFMQEAVATWAEGDRLIEQLQQLGTRIHAHVERGDAPVVFAPLLADLDRLDGRLISLEKYFSATLGRASRKTERLLDVVTVALAALLAFGGALLVRRSLRRQLTDQNLLREANQRWELGADAAGIGLFDWHVSDDRFQLDERAARLLGVGRGGATTLKRAELRARIHPDDQAFVRQRFEEAVQGGGLLRNRYRVLLPDGEVRHLESVGRLHDDAAAENARMVGIVRDVGSEIAQARLALEKESVERATRLRIEFLSRLSHELRTPLNAVLGVAQLLSIDPAEPLSPGQRKRVKLLLESGEQLLRLVEDVLDVTRFDAGSQDVQRVPTDVLGVVRGCLNVIEPERARQGVRIDDRMPQRAAMVSADPQRLEQAFVNLLSNGCKFNTRGGLLMLGYREDASHAFVTLTDEGPGLTQEQRDELFHPFKRLVPSSEAGDSSLGLVVARLLLQQMQGDVSVHSEPGRGCTFTVKLDKA